MKSFGKPSKRIRPSRPCTLKSRKQERRLRMITPSSPSWRTKCSEWCSYLIKHCTRSTSPLHSTNSSSIITMTIRYPATLGRYETYKRLQALVFWPTMSLDVRDCIRCCHVCQRYKTGNLETSWQAPTNCGAWTLGGDLMGPFPHSSTGELYLIVFVDH